MALPIVYMKFRLIIEKLAGGEVEYLAVNLAVPPTTLAWEGVDYVLIDCRTELLPASHELTMTCRYEHELQTIRKEPG